MSFQVFVEEAQMAFSCRGDQSVLHAMSHAGASCMQVGCRSGGCGVCRVQVLAGRYDSGIMSAAQVSAPDRERGIVLACQVFPRSDLRVRALGRPAGTASDATSVLIRKLVKAAPRALVAA